MKRITLSTLFLITAVSVVGAQTPPTRPVPPTPAERPVPPTPAERPVRPTPAPRAIRVPEPPYIYRIDAEEVRRAVEAARISREDAQGIRERALEAARVAREIDVEAIRANADAAREQARAAADMAREQGRAAAEMAREQARIGAEYAYSYAPLARLATPTPDVHVAPMVIGRASEDMHFARPYFIQGDPADSVYRLAIDVLNRGDFGRAAQMFKDIAQKYPTSAYQNDLPYWEAVARYKIGTTPELETAAKLLEPRASKLVGVVQSGTPKVISYQGRRGPAENEVAALYIR